eukprot:gb/GFBE01046259.1/.p1 GENE.gb/GFBE01046259.1/~~gb/GFBE01046259.1/.p1  ORF type:complete len:178 (+),score=27.94 gb/GFBE01046259.1/:1-534(+)
MMPRSEDRNGKRQDFLFEKVSLPKLLRWADRLRLELETGAAPPLVKCSCYSLAFLALTLVPFCIGFVLEQAGGWFLAASADVLSGVFVEELPEEPSLFSTTAVPSEVAAAHTLFLEAGALPLRTKGRWLVQRSGERVRLRCVNWYGAHMPDLAAGGLNRRPLRSLAFSVRALGFNCA